MRTTAMALFTLGIGAASARAEASRIIVDTLTNSAPDALPFTTTYVDPYGGNVGVGLWFVPDVDCQVIAIETAFRLDAGGPSGVDGVFSLIDNDTNTPIEMYTVPWNANDGVVGAPFHAILRKDHGYTVAYVPQPVPGQAVSGSWRSVQTAPSTTLAHDLAETGVAYEQYLAGVTYYGSYDGPQPGPLPAFRITALVDDQAGDTDGDGVDDATDNCIEVANADQADRDRDGVGDACDTCPDLYNPAQQSCASTNGNGSAGGGAATVDGGGCSAGGGASSLLVAVLLLAGTRLASRSRGRTT